MKRKSRPSRAFGDLTPKQLRQLRKDNPFRNERNALIAELWARGVKLPVLVMLTGLPRTTVHRIATTGVRYTKFRANNLQEFNRRMKQIYEEMRKFFEDA